MYNTLLDVLQDLNGCKTKTLKPNITLVNNFSDVELCHYDQVIARWTAKGFELVVPDYTPDGKLSKTTVKFINKFCPEGMACSSTKKGTFLFKNGTAVQELKI